MFNWLYLEQTFSNYYNYFIIISYHRMPAWYTYNCSVDFKKNSR